MTRTWCRHLSALGAAAAILTPSSTGGSTSASAIRVLVDPRIELLSVVCRLAGYPEYSMGRVRSYTADLDAHFATFKDHPVVVRARQLRKTRGISFNAPMSLAVHLTDPPELAERVAFDPLPPGIDPRWTTSDARAFVGDLRSFVRDAKVVDFFARQAPLFQTVTQRLLVLSRQPRIVEWLDGFFGRGDGRQFVLVAGLLNGGGNYGASARGVEPEARPPAAGTGTVEEFYSILGTEALDEDGIPSYPPRAASTIVHEFSHSFINPIVDAHDGDLKGVTDRLYALVAEGMRSQAYGLPKSLMYESLVRASTLRYLEENVGADAASREAALDRRNGFPWAERLAGALRDYERDRAKYATLDAFVPRVAAFFEDYLRTAAADLRAIELEERTRTEALAGKGPKVVSMSPAHGASDVDPGAVREITVVFDRPMRDGNFAVFPIPKGALPTITGPPRFDADGRTVRLACELKPGTAYGLQFNSPEHMAFVDTEGHPLAPFVYRFTTRK
jgi:hypothetical protein